MIDEWMTREPEEQARIAGLACAEWLPAVTTFSPFWRERADIAGLDPEKLRSLDDLAKFATVTEDEVRTVGGPGGPALVMRPTEQQVKARAAASLVMRLAGAVRREGADGKRQLLLEEYKPVHLHRAGAQGELAIASSRSDLDRMHRVGARAARVLGLTDRDVLLSAVTPDEHGAWWSVQHLALGSSMLALHPRTSGGDLTDITDAANLVTPTVVVVRADEALDLAAVLADATMDRAAIRTVVLVGPPPDEDTRDAVREAFLSVGVAEDVVVRALFSPAEARTVWAEPREAPVGLVTHHDLEVVELVDAVSGAPSATAGDLAITTMGWHGTALLRYQTGWFAPSIDRDPCPITGITAPRIVGPLVERAWQPVMDIGGGRSQVLDFRAGGRLFAEDDRVDGWRIELRGPTKRVTRDRLMVEIGGEHGDETLEALQREFEIRAGVLPTSITSRPPEEIAATVTELGSPFADGR